MKLSKTNDIVQMLILAVVCLICFIPFFGKPLHIDDPLYVWTAKHIVSSPNDFYGYRINWDWGVDLPASEVIKNPPGMSYLLALGGIAGNWDVIWMHMLVAAVAVLLILGTYCLARELDADPLIASLLTLSAPVYMMSATVVMGDILMSASWVWAVLLWVRGSRNASHACLAASALLVSISFFTKYFGICLVPLLATYLLIKRENWRICLPYLLIPVIGVIVYHIWTTSLYGSGLLFDATRFAAVSKGGRVALWEQGYICLVFAGGCMLSLLFVLPFICKGNGLLAATLIFLGNALYLFMRGDYAGQSILGAEGFQWLLFSHVSLFAAVGMGILAVAAHALVITRNAETVLLVIWITGTMVFTAYLNWTISGRNLLPCLPAIGILASRCLPAAAFRLRPVLRYVIFIAPLIVALLVAWGDRNHADSAMLAAKKISGERMKGPGEVWFQGHWGFQYYMQLYGAKPLELNAERNMRPLDILVVPSNNSFTRMPDMKFVELVETVAFRVNDMVSVMNPVAGAGYYASARGQLPYMLGKKHEETYYVFRCR